MNTNLKEFIEDLIHQNILEYKAETVPFVLAGSQQEGSSSAKLFKSNKRFEDGINRELEMDIEFTLLEIPPEYKHCVNEISNKTGFVKISANISSLLVDQMTKSNWPLRWKERIEEISTVDGYISPYFLKKSILDSNTAKEYPFIENTKFFFALVYEIPYHALQFIEVQENITKATLFFQIYISIYHKLELQVGLDFAFVVKLHWVPTILQQWIQRRKNWPPLHLISDEIKFAYLIAKPSKEEKANVDTTEMRYSFAHIERKLVSLQSYTQRLVYLIFKSTFYKWVQPIDPDSLSSFLSKTVMFWLSERYPPESRYWKADRHSITRILTQLFKELYTSFQNKFLPYYFNLNMNILQNIPALTHRKARIILLRISKNVQHYVPKANDCVLDVIHKWNRLFLNAKDFVNIVKRDGLSALATERPDLLFDFAKNNMKRFERYFLE